MPFFQVSQREELRRTTWVEAETEEEAREAAEELLSDPLSSKTFIEDYDTDLDEVFVVTKPSYPYWTGGPEGRWVESDESQTDATQEGS